jgi:Reverse transcriptase (RNA-dependent DNA polymerase)
MPFGLKNAGMTFQLLMNQILFNITYVFVYLDDMLITSHTREEHLLHLREVLGRLQDNSLVLNVARCVWGRAEVEFLWHSVSAASIGRVVALQSFPHPTKVEQLQASFGLFNFYCHFVPTAAAIVCLLTDALRSSLKGLGAVLWLSPMLQAFSVVKAAIAAATLLDHPASLLAVYSSLQHLCHMFTVFIDHKPLEGALTRVLKPKLNRQRRQLSAIAELTIDIRHIAGPANVMADTLSRPLPL